MRSALTRFEAMQFQNDYAYSNFSPNLFTFKYAGAAVGHMTQDQEVMGSNPPGCLTIFHFFLFQQKALSQVPCCVVKAKLCFGEKNAFREAQPRLFNFYLFDACTPMTS